MTIRIPRTILATVFVAATVVAVAQQAPAGLAEGLRDYQAGSFQTALTAFEEAAGEAGEGEFGSYADFWIARTLMALGRFNDASDAFDLFLGTYERTHPYREESEYQRARLFYLTGEYEAALQRFGQFQSDYPDSDFTANALYWTGESLFSLGRLAEAKRFFEEVTESYPTSFRVEAARYRQNIIDLEQRENELLTLLQWSHEEYLSALDEFQQKENSYQEALRSYRERLSSLAGEDFREEIQLLNARIGELEDAVTERDTRINELLADLRQAEANANAAMAIVGAMQAGPGTLPATTESGTQTDARPGTTTEQPQTGSSVSVQNELLSLKAAALELQQLLLQRENDE